MAPHCLEGIGSSSQCSYPTRYQPYTEYSPPCLNILHPLNYLQAPEFASKSSLQAVLGRLLSTPMLSRWNLDQVLLSVPSEPRYAHQTLLHSDLLKPTVLCPLTDIAAPAIASYPTKQRYKQRRKENVLWSYKNMQILWDSTGDKPLSTPLNTWPGVSLRRSQDCFLGTQFWEILFLGGFQEFSIKEHFLPKHFSYIFKTLSH